MDSTARETLEFLEENDIKFIRLAFCDIFGVQKNIAVMASQLGHALEHGVAFDASAIAGFGGVARSDLLLRPDLSTFTVLPWRPAESGVGLVFCNITSPDGRVFGKMAHSERSGDDLYKNVPGEKDQRIFISGVRYFA